MRFFYLLIPVFITAFSSSSCMFSGLFGGKSEFVADTVVVVYNSDSIKVQYIDSDSSYSVVTYRTDHNGRPLYMKSREYFVRQIKHGQEKKWSDDGIITYSALWNNGTPVGRIAENYANGDPKKIIEYDNTKGYILYEVNYYSNGSKKTDTITYNRGKRNGNINFYDENLGKLYETHIYARDSLIAIQISNPVYDELNKKANSLSYAVKRDSVERSKNKALIQNNSKPIAKSDWSNEENLKEKVDYLQLMLKEEKKTK
jgi:antitoxin component YwqK of YwqJK toxin-antitoxin module